MKLRNSFVLRLGYFVSESRITTMSSNRYSPYFEISNFSWTGTIVRTQPLARMSHHAEAQHTLQIRKEHGVRIAEGILLQNHQCSLSWSGNAHRQSNRDNKHGEYRPHSFCLARFMWHPKSAPFLHSVKKRISNLVPVWNPLAWRERNQICSMGMFRGGGASSPWMVSIT